MTILKGDCIEVLKAIKPNSVDAIVTDPPYGLEFMGKEWDKFDGGQQKRWQGRKNSSVRKGKIEYKNMTLMSFGKDTRGRKCLKCGHYAFSGTPCKCENPEWEQRIGTPPNMRAYQKFCTQWLTEAYRVLKPGGSMLVMGGSRTHHRLMVAIEDSGFIIKDCLSWIFGSGFPKCQDITPHIDAKVLGITTKQVKERRKVVGIKKHSDNFNNAKANKVGYLADPANKNNEKCFGYGEEKITTPLTDLAKHWASFRVGGIKPAYEIIIWAVKPPEGSYVDNILKHGVGFVNVDATRVSSPQQEKDPVFSIYHSVYGDKCLSFLDSLSCNYAMPLSVVRDVLLGIASVLRPCNSDSKDLSHNGGDQDGNQEFSFLYDNLSSRLFPNDVWCGLTLCEALNFQGDCQTCSHFCDEQIRGVEVSAQESAPLLADALVDMSEELSKLLHSHDCQSSHPSNEGVLFHISAFIHLLLTQDTSILHYINSPVKPKGRFPANVILSHHPECVQVGVKRVRPYGGSGIASKNRPIYDKYVGGKKTGIVGTESTHLDSDGLETVDSWDCHPDCAIRVMDEQSGVSKSGGALNFDNMKKDFGTWKLNASRTGIYEHPGDSGGASRFFYCAKASRGERNRGLEDLSEKDACHYNQSGRRYGGGNRENWQDPYKKPQFQNNHPTVKPIALFEWLIKLVTREGQIILDPFLGSGTTAIAAHKVGRECVGIEREDDYVEIAKRRIEHWESQPQQQELRA